MYRMKRLGLVVAALALAVAMLVSPSALAKPKHKNPKPVPDLAVTAVTIHVPSVGSQPYFVENADGSTQHFDVHVDIENIGKAAAPKSRLRVRLRQTRSACCGGTLPGLRYVGVPGLARGERALVVVDVANLQLNGLDPLRADADANYTGHIPERTYDNNKLSSALAPVIARQWKVTKWRLNGVLNVQGGGVIVDMDHNNRTDPGFSFRYSRYDSQFGIFYYTASGAITSNQTVDAVEACTGSASGHFSQTPWPSTSYLGIDYGEVHYLGVIDTTSEQYPITITCPQRAPATINVDLLELLTYDQAGGRIRPISTPVGSRSFSGTGSITTATFHGNYDWQFDADIPR
jgi:hypothetical protein